MSEHHLAASNAPLSASVSVRSGLVTTVSAEDAEPPVWVPLSSLVPADSPRLEGLDPGHAEALAEVDDELPPILVQRSTMRVIDGMHRLDAARIRGQEEIRVQFFDCCEDEA